MKAKQRGLRRKCANMVRNITQQTEVFPAPHRGANFWHLHLPVSRALIDSANTPFGVRRLYVQTIIDHAHYLSSRAPETNVTRVVAAVSLPGLWASQIIVFFDSSYFDSFFDRDFPTQKWTRLEADRSLVQEWALQIPAGFSERGYKEEINDTDFAFTGEIWFIGQL